MTTAVQPTELVFEFASNGMDEINQVHFILENLHLIICITHLFIAFAFRSVWQVVIFWEINGMWSYWYVKDALAEQTFDKRGDWAEEEEEVWEEEHGQLGAQKWKDWEMCGEVRVRGRRRVGLGLEHVYGAEVTLLAVLHVNLCLAVFSLPGQVCGSFPCTWMWILWNRLDCECVYMYWYLYVLSLDPWITWFRPNLTDKLRGCLQGIGYLPWKVSHCSSSAVLLLAAPTQPVMQALHPYLQNLHKTP